MSTIRLRTPQSRYAETQLSTPIDLTLAEGENVVLLGPNGGGKSLIAKYISGTISLASGEVVIANPDGSPVGRTQIETLSFRDLYRLAGESQDDYYQKRWHATENDQSPSVHQILGAEAVRSHKDLLKKIGVDSIVRKRLINLSSGEQRKLLIVRQLLRMPRVLIVDNPYIGLDPESRQIVSNLICQIAQQTDTKVVLLISHYKDLPEWIDTIWCVKNRTVVRQTTRNALLADEKFLTELFPEHRLAIDADQIPPQIAELRQMPRHTDDRQYEWAVDMKDVCISYGQTRILHKLSWKIARGEKWSLLGKNGSGKSTLLSLVCADNPQAYANDITLFDRPRGSGESIWDIKKHIGYVSPDMHAYYRADIACVDVVASGLFDAIGLYKKPTNEQRQLARRWMHVFGAEHLADKPFLRVSYGEQRLVLLVRVFVKSPSLVILDEPLHGLDAGKKRLAKLLIEDYCKDPDVTLIYVTHYPEEVPSVVSHNMNLVKNV